MEVRTHSCRPFEWWPNGAYRMQLHGCKSFLMVVARNKPVAFYHRHQCQWLIDVFTKNLRGSPSLLEDGTIPKDSVMCDLHWNVIV